MAISNARVKPALATDMSAYAVNGWTVQAMVSGYVPDTLSTNPSPQYDFNADWGAATSPDIYQP